MDQVLFAFLFFLPAGVANMAPVIANKMPLLNKWDTPLDYGGQFRGRRIFGDHKTWRGLVFGVALAMLVGYAQYLWFYQPNGQLTAVLAAAGLLGFGALAGDAIESFFKRQLRIASGDSWFPFDQVDYIIGGLLMSLFFVRLEVVDYVMIFAIYTGLHLLVSFIGYKLNFKRKPI